MATMFGALGGMTSWGYFFFENRDMCPCAPAGLENAEDLKAAVAQPYSDDLIRRRLISFGGFGALIGIAVGIAVVAPRASRLRKFEDLSGDEIV